MDIPISECGICVRIEGLISVQSSEAHGSERDGDRYGNRYSLQMELAIRMWPLEQRESIASRWKIYFPDYFFTSTSLSLSRCRFFPFDFNGIKDFTFGLTDFIICERMPNLNIFTSFIRLLAIQPMRKKQSNPIVICAQQKLRTNRDLWSRIWFHAIFSFVGKNSLHRKPKSICPPDQFIFKAKNQMTNTNLSSGILSWASRNLKFLQSPRARMPTKNVRRRKTSPRFAIMSSIEQCSNG